MSLLRRAEEQRQLQGSPHSRRVQTRAENTFNEQVRQYRRMLLEEIDLEELSTLELGQRRVRLERVMSHLLSQKGPVMSARDRRRVIQRVVDEALGLGILEPLLADESVTEIMVNGPHDIFVERAGRLERLDMEFSDSDQLMQVIDRIVAGVNRRVDESSPMVDARLPSGEQSTSEVPNMVTAPTL